MRANARAILIEALGCPIAGSTNFSPVRGRLWSRWLLEKPKTDCSIRRRLSLAFLAPEIVKTAVEGRLPRGFGLKRLVDLPMAWPDQWRTLGLQAPAQE
jgi:site-specific DNA recombinase